MFRAGKMRAEDFPFAVQLANTMDWNMAESDFEFMTKLEPDGCFLAFQTEEPIGIATCVSYRKTGWFGNLSVKEEHRRKGAGTFLVKHAVEYLRTKGVETVGLYAYSHLVGFYEKVGFKPHDDFVVLNGEPLLCKQHGASREADEKDVPALIEFDRRCFGGDRTKLLKPILLEKGNLCYLSVQNGEIAGFAAAKVYEAMAEIGPLVCHQKRLDVAGELLRTVLCRLRNLDVYVCVPAKAKAILATLLNVGLKENFRVTRMFLGPVNAQNCIYLPESLERG
jgi:ribosomal protein S18 acetylase RimI-like enzyme